MTRALKLWLAAAILVVFLAGGALGLFVGALHARHIIFLRHGPRMADRMQRHLQNELSLTPEQMQQVSPVVERMSTQLDAIRQETSARVAATMNQAHEEMLPLLTPEQRQRLNEMRQRHQHMMHSRDIGRPDSAPNEQ